ncbi:MAG: ATP-dependent zinc metalloprotease FtsH [Gemmatimonadaceae bacterium]
MAPKRTPGATGGPDGPGKRPVDPYRKKQFTFSGGYLLFALALFWALQLFGGRGPRAREVPYSEFLSRLRAGQVERVEVSADAVEAVIEPPAGVKPDTTAAGMAKRTIVATRVPGVQDDRLVEELQSRRVTFIGRAVRPSLVRDIIIGWLPILLLIAFYWFSMTRMAKRGGPLSVGKTQAKIYDRNQGERVTFADVAGVEEAKAELVEVVNFLEDSVKYRALGARIPKGVLLVGPPGTGKTLLARAVAGEAGVPFFSLSGSEFVEMFVGVGAARMRNLFEQAKERAPCIVFIDELDAIGKARGGVAAMATHDEREQTLNQLLVEMDGFGASGGASVIIMAATNRPEVLDQALLRPGRFDRQVLVDRPTVEGRQRILEVHARRITLGPDVRIDTVAQRTVGMVGADLANVVNEAALAAGRRGAQRVEQRDFEEAVDRIQLGLKKHGKVMGEEEKRRVAYHEAGHAIVALMVEHADPVHRVTIIPRSIGALGVTLQLPTEDKYLVTRGELTDRIAVMLGGRAAEEIALDDVSTGAHNDFERASETARQMVTKFGMSARLGPVTFGRSLSARFLNTPFDSEERNYSEETARAIDGEVREIIDAQHERAVAILRAQRPALERMAELLLQRETIERSEIEALLGASIVNRRIRAADVAAAARLPRLVGDGEAPRRPGDNGRADGNGSGGREQG